MKAITVEPLQRESARVEDVPEPDPRNGSVLVAAIAVGVAVPTWRLSRVGTAGRRRDKRVACSDTSRWAASSTRDLPGRFARGARGRHRAAPRSVPCRTAPSVNGSCSLRRYNPRTGAGNERSRVHGAPHGAGN